VDLWKPHHGDIHPRLKQRLARHFRCDARVRVVTVENILARRFPGLGAAHAGAGRDDQRPAGALELRTHRFDDAPVFVAVCREIRKIMVEGCVDHRVRLRRAGTQAFGILQHPPIGFRPSRRKRPLSALRSRQAKNLMPGVKQFRDDARSDEAGRACQKNSHGSGLVVARRRRSAYNDSCKSSDVILV
jgi:hypothetical protein